MMIKKYQIEDVYDSVWDQITKRSSEGNCIGYSYHRALGYSELEYCNLSRSENSQVYTSSLISNVFGSVD